MNLPKHLILSIKRNVGGCCNHCGRSLKHVVQIKETESGDISNLGAGCVKTVTGKTLKDIFKEEKVYKEATRILDINNKGKIRIQEYKELNEDMMNFIESNLDNPFLKSMYKTIEEFGTLSPNMYNTVYSMMLPLETEKNPKDVVAKVIKVSKKQTDFGTNWTLFVEQNRKLSRLFFSSLNAKNHDLFVELGLLEPDGSILIDPLSKDIKVMFSGTFDGYKVKRIKIKKG
jgi:hypothetical protein